MSRIARRSADRSRFTSVMTAPVMGSEDFSYFAQVVPACFYFLGAGDATHQFPNHHPAFDIDENAMASGIAAHVAVALAATSSSPRR